MFNSVFRQYFEVWALQLPFLHSLRDLIPPSEAYLYGHINWSLAQVQQQSSMGLSEHFSSKRGGKVRLQTGYHFTVQKRPLPCSSGASLAKRPHLESGNEACPGGKKSTGGSVSTSSAKLGGRGAMGVGTPDVLPSSASSSSTSGSLFSMVIMLSSLIYRMLIYIFLLLSTIIVSYNLFGTICLISGRFYLLGWPQYLGFSLPSLNLFCSFAIVRVSVLLSIWMTSWSWFTLSGQVRGLSYPCVPYWFALDYILIFPSVTFVSLRPLVSWGYVGILSACQYPYLLIS